MTAPHMQVRYSQSNKGNFTIARKRGTGTPSLQVEGEQLAPTICRPFPGPDVVFTALVRVSPCSLRRGSHSRSRGLFLLLVAGLPVSMAAVIGVDGPSL